MKMTYLTQPPKKWTFEQPKLKQYIESMCMGKVLNLFAGKIHLSVVETRIDVSQEFNPDIRMDAYEYVLLCRENTEIYDTIILDPPYNLRKSREKYNGKYIGSFTKIKNELPEILSPGGLIITLGYDTVGMARCRGFEKIAICVICHNGDHNDTLCVVERKIRLTNNDKRRQIINAAVSKLKNKNGN